MSGNEMLTMTHDLRAALHQRDIEACRRIGADRWPERMRAAWARTFLPLAPTTAFAAAWQELLGWHGSLAGMATGVGA